MRLTMTRLFVPIGLAALLGACDAERSLAPGDDQALLATAGTPTSLIAGASSDVALWVSWQDNSPNETGFEVHRSTTGPAGPFTLLSTTAANVTNQSDLGLTPLTEYCYRVRTVRIRGGKPGYSDFSNTACATTLGHPGAPSGLRAVPVGDYSGTVTLTWTATATATGYRVQRSATGTDPWEVLPATGATSYSDAGRPSEQQLCYRVVAYNTYGESDPSSTDCTAIPAAPDSLVASSSGTSGIDLTWADRSALEDGYEIQRALGDYVFSVVGMVAANATTYHDASASPDTRYWYRVRAMRDGGFSLVSNYAGGLRITTPPSAPTNLQATPYSSTRISVFWSGTSDTDEGYRVERSVDGGATWNTAGTIAALRGSRPEIVDDGRTPDQWVQYRVFAFNSLGDSPPSASYTTAAPKAPTGLVVTVAGSDALDLTWNDESTVEDGYEVRQEYCYFQYSYYGYGYFCDWETVAVLPAGTTSWRSTGLEPGTSRTYEVLALRNDGVYRGYSDPSNAAWATTSP